jgi:hypothetical protein
MDTSGADSLSSTEGASDPAIDSTARNGTKKPLPRSFRNYAIGMAVALALIVVGGVVLTEYYHHSPASTTSGSTTLAPVNWAVVTLGVDQFADIPFTTTATETLTGAFETENTITVYVMDPSDFSVLVNKGTVVGYAYTTGQEWQGTINDTVSPGTWNLVFMDTNPYGSSGVSITQAVVLTPLPS